jgi:DNA-binding NarL/FixJ family response regulator
VRQGHTYAEVGAQLYLSMRAVEWHLSRIFSKLGGGSGATCPPRCNTWLRASR